MVADSVIAAAEPNSQSAPKSAPKQPAITVVICTYNGAKRVPEVLDRLMQQVGTTAFSWQVLVVDNNSTDETAAVVSEYQQAWPAEIPLHYLFEPRQGAAYARQLAMQEAASELVGFLDDDNLPNANWVAAAHDFGRQHPQVGAYGSQIHGQFEGPVPEGFERIRSFFALTQRGETPHPYLRRQRVLPPSAGLVVRRRVWLKHVPAQLVLTGRHNERMLTGEDLEAVSYLQIANWEVWHNPAMKLWHKIPNYRLQRDYLLPFFRGVGFSRHVTRMLNLCPWQRPLMLFVFGANDLRKALMHLLIYRMRLRTDLVPACELQLYCCSLVSPLYIWWFCGTQQLHQFFSSPFALLPSTPVDTSSGYPTGRL